MSVIDEALEAVKAAERARSEARRLLREAFKARDDRGLNVLLAAAHRDSLWTLRELGEAVGLSAERVRQRIAKADEPAPPPPFEIPDEVLTRLRRLHEHYPRGYRAHGPEGRRAGEECVDLLASLVEQGATIAQLAKALGVAWQTISLRLGAYGYRELPPSQRDGVGAS